MLHQSPGEFREPGAAIRNDDCIQEFRVPPRRSTTVTSGNEPTLGAPERFAAALDALVERVRHDRAILAALLCGSLAHDTVWARSDIDLVLVTIDDKLVEAASMSLDADGINVHAMLVPRAQFKRLADGAMTNSFMHSLFAKGRLLFSHDDSIAPLLERMRSIGDRDTRILLLGAATEALACLYKARKWLLTRDDANYAALWILEAANPLARIAVMDHGELADREVVPRALTINPAFFSMVYTGMLNGTKSRTVVHAALEAAESYLAERIPAFSAPIVAWLEDVGETRSCTEIDTHFMRSLGVQHVSGTCEYLADQGIIGRASITSRLTRKSSADVQELAFFALTPPSGEF